MVQPQFKFVWSAGVISRFTQVVTVLAESDQILKIDYDSTSLPLKDAEFFHRHVVRLLFASKRITSDILFCVAFLCTRVKVPTEQDYKKLGRVISCLKETVHLPLNIGVGISGTLT